MRTNPYPVKLKAGEDDFLRRMSAAGSLMLMADAGGLPE